MSHTYQPSAACVVKDPKDTPPLIAQYLEAKVGRGCFFKYLISLIHSPPNHRPVVHDVTGKVDSHNNCHAFLTEQQLLLNMCYRKSVVPVLIL